MSNRGSPPEKKAPGSRPSKPGHGIEKLERSYRSRPPFASAYRRLLAQRLALGMLKPFICCGCSQLSLDALGRLGKHEWLCSSCADGVQLVRKEANRG